MLGHGGGAITRFEVVDVVVEVVDDVSVVVDDDVVHVVALVDAAGQLDLMLLQFLLLLHLKMLGVQFLFQLLL